MHTLHTTTDSAPITRLAVYDLGVSDHKIISMELPFPHPRTKPKHQVHFRNFKHINTDILSQDLHRLSSVIQNSAARVLMRVHKYDHILY